MTVAQFIEELKKMPPQALQQDIVIKGRHGDKQIAGVSWQGNRTAVEVE